MRKNRVQRRLAAALVLLFFASFASGARADSASRLDEVLRTGKLRVCTPGDYKPFALAKTDGTYEGIDIDLMQAAAKALGVQIEMIKTSWPKLMDDFLEKCDVGVGGIS